METPIKAVDFHYGLRVLILPMRNGNAVIITLAVTILIVLILPMRNGNIGIKLSYAV